MAAVEAKCSDYSAADDGQSSRTCSGINGGERGFMLFGVRVMTEASFRKSASMNNLAQFDRQTLDSNTNVAAGYVSDDVVHPSARSRERRRGVPWSEEEHRLFLLGLQRVGKGDWRGISRNYVKTRTPTQVASHAQKYFIRRNNQNRRRRRSSLFDITTDTTFAVSASEEQMYEENRAQTPLSLHNPCNILDKVPMAKTFPVVINPLAVQNPLDPMESLTFGRLNQMNNSPKPLSPIPILPVPSFSRMANLNLNNNTEHDILPSLSLSSQPLQQPPQPQSNQELQASNQQGTASRHFQGMPDGFKGSGGDNIIRVA